MPPKAGRRDKRARDKEYAVGSLYSSRTAV